MQLVMSELAKITGFSGISNLAQILTDLEKESTENQIGAKITAEQSCTRWWPPVLQSRKT